jgi:uncharacterized membrane protein YhaH (DUF805 family)
VGIKLARLFSFSGRMNRSTWWATQILAPLGFILLWIVATIITVYVASALAEDETLRVQSTITKAGTNRLDAFKASIQATSDKDNSVTGAEEVIIAISGIAAVVGYVVVYFAANVKRLHDLNNTGWWLLASLIPLAGGIYLTIALGFFKGTEGPNRFGFSQS